jgi:hypothetical protein
MIHNKEINNESHPLVKDKILLALLPYWTPQIPPMGISCLKSFIEPHGYEVSTCDINSVEQFRKIYNKYFDTVRSYISEKKRGNFYNIGHEVLQNHFMAHLHKDDEKEYIALVKELIYKTFYVDVSNEQVYPLNEAVKDFYDALEVYFLQILEREKPTVLGLSVYKGNVPAAIFVFKLTKEKYPSIKTVMGGAVFAQSLGIGTENFEYFLEKTESYIDKIIVGEGELLLLKLLESELDPDQRVYTQKDIDNRWLDLSTATIPDYSNLDLSIYPNMATYTSRSCPFECKFCTETVYWGKYRKKKASQVVGELMELYDRHRFQLYLLCDSLLNPIVNSLSEELINTERSIYFDGYLRVDPHVCNREKTIQWRRGGFYRARLGVESGSPRILKEMNKDIAVEQIKKAVKSLAEAGIKTTTYWIIGYPGETEEDFQMTLDLIEELKDDIYEAECNPFGFYLTGQVASDDWAQDDKSVALYSSEMKKMLILQSYIMDGKPDRQETYRRISRFVDHTTNLGIANPYSLYDISQADERWKKLHKNAVPSLLEFRNKENYIDENKHIKKIYTAQNKLKDTVDFGF